MLLFVQSQLRRRVAVLTRRNQELLLTEERSRLTRDIHDHLGADLTHLALSLSEVEGQVGTDNLQQQLAGLSRQAEQLMGTVQELVWATNPQCDRLDSVANFLSEECSSMLSVHGIDCELELPLPCPARSVNAAFRHQLVLMVKEALNNVIKHSHATRVSVSMEVGAQELVLEIRDDGCGLPPSGSGTAGCPDSSAKALGGNGLQNMLERCTALGGQFSIRSRSGEGTCVRFSLPIAPLDAAGNQQTKVAALEKTTSS